MWVGVQGLCGVNLGCSLVIGKCVFGRCVHACVFRC